MNLPKNNSHPFDPNSFVWDDDDFIAKDTFYPMKCIKCGYEQKMPDFVYSEEADFKKEPCFHCPRCDKPAFYLKRIALEKMKTSK